MVEKRQLKRRHLIYYLRVFDRTTDQLIGYLVDITTGGLKLMSEEPLDINKTLQLRMELPVETSHKFINKPVTFDAVSLRSDVDVNPQFYITGFKILVHLQKSWSKKSLITGGLSKILSIHPDI